MSLRAAKGVTANAKQVTIAFILQHVFRLPANALHQARRTPEQRYTAGRNPASPARSCWAGFASSDVVECTVKTNRQKQRRKARQDQEQYCSRPLEYACDSEHSEADRTTPPPNQHFVLRGGVGGVDYIERAKPVKGSKCPRQKAGDKHRENRQNEKAQFAQKFFRAR
jgi:hypothetical protein